ncbi:TNT domain-containing protein [Nocardiopsis halotolerans]|uniref:TNT domain-containing protein n=1 Tax=Nocardiopsis halotolerans TaxID=124252 RepID=UPI00034C800E|nr:glycohydrolase toxin TNT-related protein [Nocardiopsis halotolerans]
MKLPVTVGTALALLLVAAPVHAAPVPHEPGTAHCPVLDPPPGEEDLERYLCGDPRLGPAELPEDGPVGALVEGYDRLGDLTPVEFLDRWATPEGWDYPDHMGFVVEDGEPVTRLRTLSDGAMLDRFGSSRGTFLAPAGAPYERRALPPDSLNTWPNGAEHNYNCYEVTEEFTALVGPIAPHFEQPGGGQQVLVPAEGVVESPEAEYASVDQLLGGGYVEQRPAEECVMPRGFANYLHLVLD